MQESCQWAKKPPIQNANLDAKLHGPRIIAVAAGPTNIN